MAVKINGTTGIETPNVTASSKVTTGALTNTGTYNGGHLSFRNLIHNGNMRISQRATSATISTGSGYVLDRWKTYMNTTGSLTITQDTDAPEEFTYSTKYACASTDTSLTGTDRSFFWQYIESSDLQHLKYGTSNARPVTISFWVKSNKTGTYVCVLHKDTGTAQVNSRTYTIDVADTWEYKTITIPGNTVHDIQNNGSYGMLLYFCLCTGPDYSSGTANGGWVTAGSSAYFPGQTVNLVDSTSNYFNITGIQMEVGDTATPFEHKTYAEDLRQCQRYYQIPVNDVNDQGSAVTMSAMGVGRGAASGTAIVWALPISVPMRTTPSVTTGGATGTYYITDGTSRTNTTPTSVQVNQFQSSNSLMGMYYAFGSVVVDDDRVCMVGASNTVKITLDADW